MSPELIAIIIVGLSNAATLALLWSLHHEVAGLRERVARLEERFAYLEERFAQFEKRMSRLEGCFEEFIGRGRTAGESDTGT